MKYDVIYGQPLLCCDADEPYSRSTLPWTPQSSNLPSDSCPRCKWNPGWHCACWSCPSCCGRFASGGFRGLTIDTSCLKETTMGNIIMARGLQWDIWISGISGIANAFQKMSDFCKPLRHIHCRMKFLLLVAWAKMFCTPKPKFWLCQVNIWSILIVFKVKFEMLTMFVFKVGPFISNGNGS